MVNNGPYSPGDTVSFVITVENQGDIDATNVEVTDYMPAGLTLNDSDWTVSGTNATQTIASLAAGTNTQLTINFTVDSDAPEIIRNFAEISRDDGDDCDSTADNIDGNQQ